MEFYPEEKEEIPPFWIRFKKRLGNARPTRIILLGYIAVILLGALLLLLPQMVNPGNQLSPLDALFTSTSAICVTGLIVVDTATFFSFWGQLTILILLQIGGLGYMTMTTLIALVLGRKIEYRDRLALKESFTLEAAGGVVRFVLTIVKYTLVIEGVGAVILCLRFLRYFPWQKALFAGVFHSISAFCNAGFSVFSNSLEDFVRDPVVNFTVMCLIIAGGIGFIVLKELLEKGRLTSLHSKVVITVTLFLIGLSAFLFAIFEWNNPQSIAFLEWPDKIMASLFQAITPRTAGFNTIPIANLQPATVFMLLFLMFVGASPGGTGGGIKTTAFALIWGVAKAVIAGKEKVNLFHRRVPQYIVFRAIALAELALVLVGGISILMLLFQPGDPLDILFEVFSAYGTVGLSRGITGELLNLSKFLIIITMYVGKVGLFTIIMYRIAGEQKDLIAYPEEKISI
ncbi:MAG: trk/ktr system potassium uptake protein [Candidatus Atribacteria bacterium]|nr:trk/ktr system potassium uptake protein [Candidatus Atribacteria bacterium]